MSKGARRLARGLAALIVRDCVTEQQIADLLYPVCVRADTAALLKRKLRKAAARHEQVMRAARSPAPRGFVTLDPARFRTTLTTAIATRPVNGHALDIAIDPAALRPPHDHPDNL